MGLQGVQNSGFVQSIFSSEAPAMHAHFVRIYRREIPQIFKIITEGFSFEWFD